MGDGYDVGVLVVKQARGSATQECLRDNGRERLPRSHKTKTESPQGRQGELSVEFLSVSELCKTVLVGGDVVGGGVDGPQGLTHLGLADVHVEFFGHSSGWGWVEAERQRSVNAAQ